MNDCAEYVMCRIERLEMLDEFEEWTLIQVSRLGYDPMQ